MKWNLDLTIYSFNYEKILLILLLSTGCSMLFNADKYNPNPTPKPICEEVCCEEDTVKTEPVKIIIIE